MTRRAHKTITKLLLTAMLFAWPLSAFADEPQAFRRSIRALGMGNAFVAIANDENALFYNPAGLQSVERTVFELLTLQLHINQSIVDLADNDSTGAVGELAGTKLLGAGDFGVISLTAPGWGYQVFSGILLDASVHNPVIPYFDLLAYAQTGVIGGFGFSLNDYAIDIGASFKVVQRAGIGKIVHIIDGANPDELQTSIEDDFVNEQKVSPDIGAIYHYDAIYNFEIKAAAVMKNIGGMDFGSSGSIPTTIDIGVSSNSEFLGLDVLLAVDHVDVTYAATEKKSFARNLNMGVEAGMWMLSNGHHFLSVRAGKKGPYATMGFTINPPFVPLTIDYAKWSEEIGLTAGGQEDPRQSVQISFNF